MSALMIRRLGNPISPRIAGRNKTSRQQRKEARELKQMIMQMNKKKKKNKKAKQVDLPEKIPLSAAVVLPVEEDVDLEDIPKHQKPQKLSRTSKSIKIYRRPKTKQLQKKLREHCNEYKSRNKFIAKRLGLLQKTLQSRQMYVEVISKNKFKQLSVAEKKKLENMGVHAFFQTIYLLKNKKNVIIAAICQCKNVRHEFPSIQSKSGYYLEAEKIHNISTTPYLQILGKGKKNKQLSTLILHHVVSKLQKRNVKGGRRFGALVIRDQYSKVPILKNLPNVHLHGPRIKFPISKKLRIVNLFSY